MKPLKQRLAAYKHEKACRLVNGQTGLPRATAFERNWYRRQADAFGLGAGIWQDDHNKHNPSARAYYIDTLAELGWRTIGEAHRHVRLNHTGWYTDSNQDETAAGYVLQLPARDGECQYVPAVVCSQSCGVTVYPLDRYDEIEDCARAADGYAETFAEQSREWDAKQQAEFDIQQARDDIQQMRADCLALIREIKADRKDGRDFPIIRRELLNSVSVYRSEINRARELIARRQDNFWSAVEG